MICHFNAPGAYACGTRPVWAGQLTFADCRQGGYGEDGCGLARRYADNIGGINANQSAYHESCIGYWIADRGHSGIARNGG